MPFNRNTRIVCTMGPAVEDIDKVRALVRRGMNVARFNFSHGNHEYHGKGIARVREASRLEGLPVALLLDTKGPEIRTGQVLSDGKIELVKGDKVRVASSADLLALEGPASVYATAQSISVSYAGLVSDVKVGTRILISDGLVALEVVNIDGKIINCVVLDGGEFGSHKNVNVLGVKTKLPVLSEIDMKDLRFGVEQGMDYIAASFIRKASDVTTIQRFLDGIGSKIPVIAKIEDEEGLENIEEIVRVASGIMVARGDLGVQIPVERVPLEQKRIIRLCNEAGKPVITATQMLDSMIKNPRPTRAEAGDVANAIMDGSDCVMLSGETASGLYPEAAVEVMDRIARSVESSPMYLQRLDRGRRATNVEYDITLAIAEAASWTADRIDAVAIIAPTMSGNTARLISRSRPHRRIIAASPDEAVCRRLLLHWGVVPVLVDEESDSEAMIQGAIAATIHKGYAAALDRVVVVAGLPIHSPLMTNSIRVHVIGNVLGRGGEGFGGRCTGRIVKARNLDQAVATLREGGGEVLLTHTLDESFIPVLRLVDGVILEGVSEMPWEMINATNPSLVYVSQVPSAMDRFEEHLIVTLDGNGKLVYEGIC